MKNDSEQNQIAIIATTKKGIHIARRIQDVLSNVDVYIPNKFYNSECTAIFFNEPVAQKIEKILILKIKKYLIKF